MHHRFFLILNMFVFLFACTEPEDDTELDEYDYADNEIAIGVENNSDNGGPYYSDIYPEYCEVVSPQAHAGEECDYLVESLPYTDPKYLLSIDIQEYPHQVFGDVGVLGIDIRPEDNRATFEQGSHEVTGLSFYQTFHESEYPRISYAMPMGTMVHKSELAEAPDIVTHVFHSAHIEITGADAIPLEEGEQSSCEVLQREGTCGRQYVTGTASFSISKHDATTTEPLVFKFASHVDWYSE